MGLMKRQDSHRRRSSWFKGAGGASAESHQCTRRNSMKEGLGFKRVGFRVCKYIHTIYIYIYTYIHTYIHTYIDIYIYRGIIIYTTNLYIYIYRTYMVYIYIYVYDC